MSSTDVSVYLNPVVREDPSLPQIQLLFYRDGLIVRAWRNGESFEFGGLDWAEIEKAQDLIRKGSR